MRNQSSEMQVQILEEESISRTQEAIIEKISKDSNSIDSFIFV